MAKQLKQNRILGVKVGPAHPKSTKVVQPGQEKRAAGLGAGWVHLKSNDPRKPRVVAALKAKSGCSKITNVEAAKDGSAFQADCLKKGTGRGFQNLGTFGVTAAEAAGLVEAAPEKEKTPAKPRKALIIDESTVPDEVLLAQRAATAGEKIVAELAKKEAAANAVATTTCLAKGCLERIPVGSAHRRCPKHAAAFQAKAQKLANKVAKEITVQLNTPKAKAALQAMAKDAAAHLVTGKPVTTKQGVAVIFATSSKGDQRSEAKRITRQLVQEGVRVAGIAAATGVTDGSVYRWYRAASAPTPAQYEKLLMLQAASGGPPQADVARGNLKAPRAVSTAAKASRAKPGPDPRQLMLQLRDALNAVLAVAK